MKSCWSDCSVQYTDYHDCMASFLYVDQDVHIDVKIVVSPVC